MFALLVAGACLVTSSACASPRLSGSFKRLRDSSPIKPLFINVKTPEGIHSFVFTRTPLESEEDEELNFGGVLRRPLQNRTQQKGSLSFFGSRGYLYFSSRRHGRPYSITFTLARSSQGLHIAETKVASVPRGFMSCAVGATESRKAAPESPRLTYQSRNEARQAKPTRILEVAAEADYAFFKKLGTETRNYIRSSLRAADVLYTSELGIHIKLTSLRVANRDSRRTSALSAENILESFRNQSTPTRVAADVHHLFTGSELDGVTIGIAYVGTACLEQGRYNTGVSRAVNRALQPVLAAHEIAHNLGAVHDQGRYSVMNPAPRASKASFSPKARLDIQSFVETAGSCVSLGK